MRKWEGDAVDRPLLVPRSCVKAMERKNTGNMGHSERKKEILRKRKKLDNSY